MRAWKPAKYGLYNAFITFATLIGNMQEIGNTVLPRRNSGFTELSTTLKVQPKEKVTTC